MRLLVLVFHLFLALSVKAAVSWSATPFNPPSFPLAVRTPYLSCWLPQGSGTALNGGWPQFWAGQILGWAGFVKVDGNAFSFLGDPGSSSPFTKAVQKSSKFTATQSIFVLSAGPVDLTVTFLSPVEPNDLAKQSFPFSYMSVSATATDGNAHQVQVYSDISAEWVSGDPASLVNWSTTTGSVLTHSVQLQNATTFGEIKDQANYGAVYYVTQGGIQVTFQTGADADVRNQFLQNGRLANSQDTKFRAINDKFPVFGFAHDLGSVTSPTPPVVVAVGHVRDPALEYITAGGVLQNRSSYFFTRFTQLSDAISSFLTDYPNAVNRANAFDTQVQNDASGIHPDYAGIVALSIRQAFGATEITVSKRSDNSFNTDDVLVFMKEISSDGNINTVDVVFPAWPMFLYTNPVLGKNLLEVLLAYQATGQYPNKFASHDIGSSYPRAIGHNDGKDEPMPVEESGNMIIMALSYAQKTGDTSQLQKYFNLFDQWTQFLIEDSLIPDHQLSTDDFAGPLANQTNLAIKGIIGIRAMAEIASLLGNKDKSANYTSIASSYVQEWQTLATASSGDHLTLSYGSQSSWGLSYNLYADRLLGFNMFPQSVYDMQTAWYQKVANPFGIPLDTRHTYTKSDWSIWTAGIMTRADVRNLFIAAVKNYAASGKSSQPFGDWYETVDGAPQGFRARPVVGGHLALLTLPRQFLATGTGINPTTQDPTDPLSNPLTDPPGLPGSGRSIHSFSIGFSIAISLFMIQILWR